MKTFAVPSVATDPKGMEEFQRSQPLKAMSEGVARLVRDFCLRKRETIAKPTFTRMLTHTFVSTKTSKSGTTVVMSLGMHLRRFAVNFPIPNKAGRVLLPVFPRTRELIQKAEVTLTGADENWLGERLTGAMSLVSEGAGKER